MWNFSDRFVGVMAGTTTEGNNPHAVYEAIRHNGVIPESMLPFDRELLNTPAEYYSFKGGDETRCLVEGQKWLQGYEFTHDWILTNKHTQEEGREILKQALKICPVAVSVTAWATDNDGLYADGGRRNTHWCLLFEYDGDKPVIFDSYDHSIKTLHPNHRMEFAKRIWLKKKDKKSWLADLIERILDAIKDLFNLTVEK